MNQEILKKSKIQLTVEHIQKYWILYLMMIPATVLLILFTYGPMYGIIMAFQDFTVFKGYTGSPFVGLKHFQRLFSDPLFYRLFKNTFMVGVFRLFILFPSSAYFCTHIKRSQKSKI